jgi:hypothetical protein
MVSIGANTGFRTVAHISSQGSSPGHEASCQPPLPLGLANKPVWAYMKHEFFEIKENRSCRRAFLSKLQSTGECCFYVAGFMWVSRGSKQDQRRLAGVLYRQSKTSWIVLKRRRTGRGKDARLYNRGADRANAVTRSSSDAALSGNHCSK